ncbi:MAG: FAD-binding protein [Anaerolineaceae bacterium]|jgi:succinate dehydrogenase / fumarate reductase flavoprotein subunit
MGEKNSEQTRISRRDFVKGTIVGVAGIASAGVLTGCGEKVPVSSPSVIEETVTEVPKPIFEVHEADVLIIGGGIGGNNAALEATKLGANVMLVDKGPYGFSGGASCLHWGTIVTEADSPDEEFKYSVWGSYGLMNQKHLRSAVDTSTDILQRFLENGTADYMRLPDGNLFTAPSPGGTMAFGYLPRYDAGQTRWEGVQVFEKTMITDLLIQDGRCTGAVGINIPTGTFHVFKAKSTIAATGPYPWFWGWITLNSYTPNAPDNTGDLDAIAYRHGIELQDLEFWDYSLGMLKPEGLAMSITGGISGFSLNAANISDKNGDFWMRSIPMHELTRPRFTYEVAKIMAEGKGGPNGGVFLDLTPEGAVQQLTPESARNVAPLRDKFGMDVSKEPVEMKLRIIEMVGHPVADENRESAISGLFFAVPAGRATQPVATGDGVWAATGGLIAARKAVERAKELTDAPINLDLVNAEFERVHSVLAKQVENPIRPHVVRHHIQEACYQALGVLKSAKDYEAGLAALQKIRDEELPRMCVQNKTQNYNIEWKEALENFNILDMGELSIRASQFREESRGPFIRSDFPNEDNENWLCNVGVKIGPDGKPTVEKREIVWTEYSPDAIKQLLATGFQA